MKQIINILALVLISLLIAFAGSYNGHQINGIAMMMNCWFIAFGVHLIVFIPSFIFKTERYFDLTGMIAFLSVLVYILLSRNLYELQATGLLLIILISIWTLRLGLFLFIRILNDGSDRRFDELKVDFLKFLSVWTMSSFWVFVTSSCALTVLCSADIEDNLLLMIIGLVIWSAGFLIEVFADMQKRRFRKDHKDTFISSGLWSYSRHPNYLGEILLWFGIAVISFSNLEGYQYATLISPLFVYALLSYVSGINLLEKHADEKWGHLESYQSYKESTPVLFPFM